MRRTWLLLQTAQDRTDSVYVGAMDYCVMCAAARGEERQQQSAHTNKNRIQSFKHRFLDIFSVIR